MTRLDLAAAAALAAVVFAAATPSGAAIGKGTGILPKIGTIEVVVEQLPSGVSRTIGRVSSSGAFGGKAKLPAGNFTIHTACSQGASCPSNQLTSVQVDGVSIPLVAGGGGGGTRDFVNQALITNSNSKFVMVRGTAKIKR